MSLVSSFVRVALPLPLDRVFTYSVRGEPPELGTRVLVPFRRDKRIGFVVGHGGDEGLKGIKSVISVLESRPSITPAQLRLARWMADYYITSLGIALRSMMPSVLSDTSREMVGLLDGSADGGTTREKRVIAALLEKTPQTVQGVRRSLQEIEPSCSLEAGRPIRVKSYAPHWDHMVLDVAVSRR